MNELASIARGTLSGGQGRKKGTSLILVKNCKLSISPRTATAVTIA